MKTTLQLFITICLVTIGIIGCSNVNNPSFEEDSYSIQLNGNGLPQDANGYYLLTLSRSTYQTIYRITGILSSNSGKTEFQPQKIHIESSHFWWFAPGDTVITIYRRTINSAGQWAIFDTTYTIAIDSMAVPTTNETSYTNNIGVFSNVIAPTIDMLGDTMTVQCKWYSDWYKSDTVSNYIQIILQ